MNLLVSLGLVNAVLFALVSLNSLNVLLHPLNEVEPNAIKIIY